MGWEQLKNILDENREQAELEKQMLMSPVKCPECDYPMLRENKRGIKMCPICGWLGR